MAKTESCFHCVYARWDRNQAMWMMGVGMPSRPMCANQAEFPGRMRECPIGRVCRNFRAKPPEPKGETVKTIPLGDGYYAYVDAADHEWLSQWKWHLSGGYAVRNEKKKLIFMHRQIMQPPEGMVVDHKDRNKLDNTRENLRNATHQENTQNAGKIQGTYSRFKGVSYRKERDKYFAQIYFKGEQSYLGLYAEEIDAARAYDHRAVELFGEFARVNFPEEWPPERRAEVYVRRDDEKEPVGATHASPVRGRSKATKAGKRKTKKPEEGKRTKARGGTLAPKPRATSHERRETQQRTEHRRQKTAKGKSRKSRAETQNARRKTKSPSATGPKPRDTKTKGQKQRRTRPAEKKTRGTPGNS